MLAKFTATGFGVASGLNVGAVTALSAILRVRGAELKALANQTTTKNLFYVGSSSGANAHLSLQARQGASGAGFLKLTFTSKSGSSSIILDNIDITTLTDSEFYNIYICRDPAPPTGVDAIEISLYDDSLTELRGDRTAIASSLISDATKNYVSIGASPDGNSGVIVAVDGIAIYSGAIAPADRPAATPPATDAAKLLYLWTFKEGSGLTATDEVASAVMTLSASTTWETDGDWGNFISTELRFTTEPIDSVVGLAMEPFVVSATDASGNKDANATGNVTIALNSTKASILSGTLTKALTLGKATFDDIVLDTIESDLSFDATHDGSLTGDTSAAFDSLAPEESVPLSGESDVHVTMQKGATAGDATKAYITLRNSADGTAYTTATGTVDLITNGVASTSTNDLVHIADGRYYIILTAAELAANGIIIVSKSISEVICYPCIVTVISADPYASPATVEEIADEVETRVPTESDIVAAILGDETLFGTNKTLGKFFKLLGALFLGKTSTSVNTYRNLADTADVIVGTVDSSTKARSNVTVDWDNA